jgi:hypothetical protein
MLHGIGFTFICIDRGRPKKDIVAFLEASDSSFIDVGMGVQIADGSLLGIQRVTASTPANRHLIKKHVTFDDGREDDYASNIQIADLNMLNAALAVVRWKKLCGFYQDMEREHHSTFTINVNQLLSE